MFDFVKVDLPSRAVQRLGARIWQKELEKELKKRSMTTMELHISGVFRYAMFSSLHFEAYSGFQTLRCKRRRRKDIGVELTLDYNGCKYGIGSF